MVKTILVEMKKYVDEERKEQGIMLSLSSLTINNEPENITRVNILLDGVASHNVYFGPKNT